MNIDKITENNVNLYSKSANLEEGSILNGEIKEEKDGKYNISLDKNVSINIDKNKIVGEVGDKVSFCVVDNKNNLRQVVENKQEEIVNYTQKVTNNRFCIPKTQQKYALYLNKNSQPSVQENIMYKTNLKNKLSHIANATSEEKLQGMVNDNLNPEKLDLFSFSDYISESLGEKRTEKDKPKTLKELKEEKGKNMKMDLNMNGVDEEAIFTFQSIFDKTNLPATAKNVESLNNIKDKVENIKSIDKATIMNLVNNKKNPTLEDVYSSKYARFNKTENTDVEKIEDFDIKLKNLIDSLEIESNEENLQIAKDFIKNDLEISKEAIEKYKKIENIEKNIDMDKILEQGAKNILKNKNPLEIDLFSSEDNYIEKYKGYKKIISEVSESNIQELIDKKIPINLENIAKEYKPNFESQNISDEAISQKLTLAKIQMKMTSENIYALAKNGIDIDTKPLKQVIAELENIEKERYAKSLENVKALNNEENVQAMTKIFDSMQNIYPKKVYNVFRELVNQEIDFSIDGINKGIKAKSILKDLDTFKTDVSKKFGDSLKGLDEDFETLLFDNGFEVNETNKKALKILTLNEMDFTDENLINVKLIDKKLDYIHDNLHPITVSKMLKEGFNPLDKDINDVIEYIEKNSDKKTSREKIAEQILDIDNENKLSKEERNAIVSVYRMLNMIEKDSSASIGNLLKTEKNITFENLLDSAKIYQKNKRNITFEKMVDENSGERETIINEKNIKNAINTGVQKATEDYNKYIINDILNYTNYNKINEFINTDKSIEEILYNEQQQEQDKKVISDKTKEDILENIRNLENLDKQTLDYFYETGMKININNINVLENIVKENIKPSNVFEDFKEELKTRKISLDDKFINLDDKKTYSKESAKQTVEDFENINNEAFDDILNLEELDDIKYMILKNKNVSSNINFLKDVNDTQNGFYCFPIKLDGKTTELSMYILNDKALDDKNLSLYFNFEKDGKMLQSYVNVSENGKNVNIVSKTDASLYENDILEILSKFDIEPDEISYETDEDKDLFKNDISTVKEKLIDMDNKFNQYI